MLGDKANDVNGGYYMKLALVVELIIIIKRK
jgi:hypothetical protein